MTPLHISFITIKMHIHNRKKMDFISTNIKNVIYIDIIYLFISIHVPERSFNPKISILWVLNTCERRVLKSRSEYDLRHWNFFVFLLCSMVSV